MAQCGATAAWKKAVLAMLEEMKLEIMKMEKKEEEEEEEEEEEVKRWKRGRRRRKEEEHPQAEQRGKMRGESTRK